VPVVGANQKSDVIKSLQTEAIKKTPQSTISRGGFSKISGFWVFQAWYAKLLVLIAKKQSK